MKNPLRSFVLPGGFVLLVLLAIVWLRPAVLPDSRQASHASQGADPSEPDAVVLPPAIADESASNAIDSQAAGIKPQENASEFVRFNDWAARYVAATVAERRGMVDEGRQIAGARRVALRELIEVDPRRAIENAVAPVVRQQLPLALAELLEERVNEKGFYGVLGAITTVENQVTPAYRREVRTSDGGHYRAYVYGRRLSQRTTENASIVGIAVDDAMAIDERPLRVVAAGEIPNHPNNLTRQRTVSLIDEQGFSNGSELVTTPAVPRGVVEVCPVSGQVTAVETGDNVAVAASEVVVEAAGEFHFLCRGGHITTYEGDLIAQEGGNGGPSLPTSPPTATQSTGYKTNLLMRVAFPEALKGSVTEKEGHDLAKNVQDWFVNSSYGSMTFMTTVTPLLILPRSEAWYKDQDTTGSAYEVLWDARTAAKAAGFDPANFNFDTVIFTGTPGAFGGQAYVGGKGCWLKSGTGTGVACHEYGHNFGLMHANFWNTTNGSSIGGGSHVEYGDSFDTMGSASAGDLQFNTYEKNLLNWLPTPLVNDVTTSGTYRIYQMDQPTQNPRLRYAIKTRKDADRDYWVEFRQLFTTNAWVQSGVFVRWSPWVSSASGTHLLDTTPGSIDAKTDAPVVIGRTFSDPETGIHITPIAKNATTPPSADVVVNLGLFPGNQAPVVAVGASATSVAANVAVNLTATASDPDGDVMSYAWDYGDKTFSTTNSPTVSKSWATAGEYRVRCTVSDMKGKTTSASVVVTVGTSTTYRIAGTITAGGQPLANVRVHNSLTGTSYREAYTDANGTYTLVRLAAGTYTVGTELYGYNLTPTGSASVTVGPNKTGVDFTAADQPVVSIALQDADCAEGANTGSFRISRTGSTAADLTVSLYAPSGSATKTTDYTLAPDVTFVTPLYTFTIPAGQTFLDVLLTATDDTAVESYESATIELVPSSGYVIGNAVATLWIGDSDTTNPLVRVRVTDRDADECGDPGQFVIERLGSTTASLNVTVALSGTATNGTDYTTIPTTVIIPSGASSVPVNVTPLQDTTVETMETVILTISTNAAYTRPASSADYAGTVNLHDDDQPILTVVATDSAAAEAGNDPGVFTVTRTGSTASALTVNYGMTGSALHGTDYAPLPGVLTIPAGSAVATVVITPIDDTIGEPAQTAVLQLRGGIGYTVGAPSNATVTITDNGDQPYASIAVTTGPAIEGGTAGVFRVTTAGTGTGNITVLYMVTGTATNGVDFTALSGSLSMAKNTTSNITITPIQDAMIEGYETVTVTLTPDPAYSLAVDPSATMNLQDDDAPQINISTTDDAFSETNGSLAKFFISRTGATTNAITVNYTLSGTATSGVDYTTPSGSVTIPAAATGAFVNISLIDDTLAEGTETIVLDVTPDPAYAIGFGSATRYIADAELASVATQVRFSAASSSVAENVGTVNIPVTLSAAAAGPVTVEYLINGGTALGAGIDYSLPAGMLVFAPGETSKDIVVAISDDTLRENSETLVIALANSNNARLGTSSHTLTITDNDALPGVTIGFAGTTGSGLESQSTAPLTVALSTAQATPVTVDYAVTGGTATATADYVITAGTLTFAAGETVKVISNMIVDDAAVEAGETIILNLTNPVGAVLNANTVHTYTITDNDASIVTIVATDANAAEPGTDSGLFTVTRTGSTTAALTVNLAVSGTARSGADYANISNTLVIAAGSSTGTVFVTPLNDTAMEATETVILTLATGVYTIGAENSVTVSIADDDTIPTVWSEIAVEQPVGNDLTDAVATINCGSINLGGSSSPVTFTVKNTGTADLTGLALSKDGANSADYALGSLGTATLAPGASTTFNVTFTPGAAGPRTAAIHIASNDPDENPFDIDLTGTGVSPGTLAVTPAGGLTSTGNFGGPFTPSSLQYTLTNPGNTSINWTATKTAGWVTLSSASGTLGAGANTTVTATININANTLNVGGFSDTVTFVNTTNSSGDTTRSVALAVSSATATVNLSGLTPTYDGAPKSATVTTTPPGLACSVTYDGSATPPTNAGTYAVVATITEPNYSGSGSGSMTINKASQTIAFGALSPVLDDASPFALSAAATSGLAVSYNSSNSSVATVSGNTVTVVGLGSTTITTSQAGDTNYNAATSVPQTLTVVRSNPLAVVTGAPYKVLIGQSLSLDGSTSQPSYGETVTTYEWDLNNDNTFGDASGATPSAISFATLTGTWGMVQGLNTIQLKITDSANKTSTVSATVELVLALTWDANGTTAGQTNGAGAWLGTNLWWDGTANQSWSAGANATFGGPNTAGGAVTLASPTSVNAITLNTFTGTYTLGTAGQSLAINGGMTNNAITGAVSLISPITLGTAQTWTNNSSGSVTASAALDNLGNILTVEGPGTIALTGVISGSGGIVKNGIGRLTFNTTNSNTYSGSTIINGGVLMMANNLTSIGSGNVTLNGGVLESYWGLTLTRALGAGDGQIQLTSGASGFGQNGGGQTLTVNFGNNAANEAVWGSTYFNPSILVLQTQYSQGTSGVTLANNLDLNGVPRTIQVSGGVTGAATATLSGVVRSSSGTAGLTKTGTGNLILSAANTYTGSTTISAGMLQIGNNTAGTLGSGTYNSGISIATGSSLRVFSTVSQTLGGVISGGGNLVKAYAGTLTLSNSNTYSGKTSLTPQTTAGAGTLIVSSFNSVSGGSASSSLGAPTTVANGTIDFGSTGIQGAATLRYTGSGETTDRSINFLFNGTGATKTLDTSGTGLLKFTSTFTGSGSVTNDIVLTGSSNGEISGGLPFVFRNLSKTGNGTWTLGGTVGNSGTTTITAGKLALGGNDVLSNSSALSIASATLDAATFADTLGTLDVTSAAVINLGAGAALAIADSSAVDWTGGTLSITGAFVPGSSLRFGTSNTALTSIQLAKISVAGFGSLFLDANGYLTDDITPPTLAGGNIVDDKSGGQILVNTLVIYTVAFSEDMDASTVDSADFGNTGTASGMIGNVTEISPGVFTVPVIPSSAGTLQLKVNAGAVLKDAAGNNLDTSFDIVDDTIITVMPLNTAPVANSQSVTTEEDSDKAITLTGSDADLDALTYTILSPPANGSLSGTAPNLTYTPELNSNGSDSFTFKVNDGSLDSAPATVSITVTAVNDAPVAINQSVTTAEDTAKAITLVGTDIDLDTLSFIIVSPPANGTLSGTAPNLTYTPASNYNGADSFNFKVNDGTVDSVVAAVSITVTAVNDAPVAIAQSVTTAEDTAKAITLSGTDVDLDAISYAIVSSPAHGTLSGTAPNLTYTPTSNYNGPDSFSFKVNDGTVDSVVATVSITVTAVNDAPLAVAQNVTTAEDTAKAIILTGADIDLDTLTYAIVSPPANGTVSGTAPNLTYTPASNYNGADSFSFKVNDGTVDSATATVSINVTAVNDAPVAVSQSATMAEDTAKAITLAGTDVDLDTLSYAIVSPPANGTLSGTAPNLTYTPALNYNGSDSFTFTVNDGTVDSDTATVSITVTADNDAPVAIAQSVTTAEDTAKAITIAGTDVDLDTLSYAIVSPPANGTLSGTAPNLTYTPTANFNGSDSFTFKVNDGTVDSPTATVSITVTAVNDTPVAVAQSVTTAEDTAKGITLAGTDSDLDTLSYAIVSTPAHGTLSGTAPNLTYTPTLNYNGSDSFTFTVNDGTVDSASATVSITDTAVNDDPVFITNPIVAAGANEGVAYTGQTLAGQATDVDAGSIITYSKVSGPAWLTVGSDGALSGTPSLGSAGLNSFVVRATDSDSATADTTLQITVVGLPLPWESSGIGTGMLAGSTTYNAGSFTQAGSGVIGSTSDKLRFSYQTLTGDGEIIAKISSLGSTGNSSRVGVMIRDTLAGNSKEIFMGMTGTNAYRWVRRTATGGSTTSSNSSTGTVPNTWVRLVRSGTTITAYKSTNGTTWTSVGSTTGTTFATTCYIGLAVGSGSDTTLNTSQFSNVSVTP